ncbi:PREDICTED: uncharacterized protein LOC109592382 [Amphimedon queenslandica]|uniref:Uncharacterized protein n=1 Tax=Amphimedon queenslandica TaxID=400682 RepID=A0AAN0K294_AMPQE|nr:PREDICTED: uncharacterized protein LOC109592382 [Amphimedon queenslandica]|eukprot:XP_019863396.1 PREDICTED: uncharacterized protein LOC109592382 [Amphimedon queenslandica]
MTHKSMAKPTVSHHSHNISASEQFRSVSYELHISISSCLIKVSMKLNAMGLISQSLNDDMIDENKSPSVKAAKLVSELQKTLNAHPNPKAYLNKVCTALKGIGEKQITDAVNKMGIIDFTCRYDKLSPVLESEHDHHYKGVYCKLCDDYHLKPEDIQQKVSNNKSPPNMVDLINLVAAKIQDKVL